MEGNKINNKQIKKEIKVVFGDINKNNYEQLRILNDLALPVKYKNGFYARISHKLRFGKFAYYNDLVVGAITWKYDICENERYIYIMTITVLEDYKRYNIGIIYIIYIYKYIYILLYLGSQLLKELIRIHLNTKEIKYINLHVQVNNDAALNFYLKHSFENVKMVENYYTDIEPKDAYYLRLRIHD
jgi:ribosomal protein S18 acetylase RimI-like enzyme